MMYLSRALSAFDLKHPVSRLPWRLAQHLEPFLEKQVCKIVANDRGVTLYNRHDVELYCFRSAALTMLDRMSYYKAARLIRQYSKFSWDPDDNYYQGVKHAELTRETPGGNWTSYEAY